MSERAVYRAQVAVVGGGVCGLWLLNALTGMGISTVLFERGELGSAQTLASQGMIHGGIKYALGGFTTPSSESIAGMPARWRACIAGEDSMDLHDVALLSDDYYLFSDKSVSSRVTAFFGSKSLRGRVNPVKGDQLPACFSNKSFRGLVYRLEDIVLDSRSLVASLARQGEHRIFRSAARSITNDAGEVQALELDDGSRIEAQAYVFAAGAGNKELIKGTCLQQVSTQLRPLHQVLVKAPGLPLAYAHAVSATAGAKPRVTITSHRHTDGDIVWYLGGNLAEAGVERTDAEQATVARKEMESLFPWLDWAHAEWRSWHIDRAEPAQKDHSRPDTPYFKAAGNAMVCWPTKLTLTPLLADAVTAWFSDHRPADVDLVLPALPAAEVGKMPWERVF